MNGDGEPFLNELGLMLHNAADAEVAVAAAPKKREKKIVEEVAEAPVAASDDVQIEV
jgi:hypothetical protein